MKNSNKIFKKVIAVVCLTMTACAFSSCDADINVNIPSTSVPSVTEKAEVQQETQSSEAITEAVQTPEQTEQVVEEMTETPADTTEEVSNQNGNESESVYPEGEIGRDFIDVDDMGCGTVGDDGAYYVVNFLKNKDFQNKINEDIRKVSDELYKYADDYDYTSSEEWNKYGYYSFNTKGLHMTASCENGYLGLTFWYIGDTDENGRCAYDHITTLVYDIIEEEKIENFDELFTKECYAELNDMFKDQDGMGMDPYSEALTSSNICAFTPWRVWIDESISYYTGSLDQINDDGTLKYDAGKFYYPVYKRDMTDYIDEAYSQFHNKSYGK